MNYVSIIADITGIISFIIGFITFLVTLRIRKKLLQHIEKSDYIQDIDNQVKNLLSYCETINRDEELYTDILLDTIDTNLEDLQIAYETILPKKLSGSIKKLRNLIKQRCYEHLDDKDAKRECAKQLHALATKLNKEKKVL